MAINTSSKYYGSESYFNGNVTFYKDVNLFGNLNLNELVINRLRVGSAVTISSGIVTAFNGFISVANTTPVRIGLSGNRVVFSAVGIGSTSFILS